jgi:hypothetical protein
MLTKDYSSYFQQEIVLQYLAKIAWYFHQKKFFLKVSIKMIQDFIQNFNPYSLR